MTIQFSSISLLQLLYYHGFFDKLSQHCDIYATSISILAAIMIWMFFMVILTARMQGYLDKWKSYERLYGLIYFILEKKREFLRIINRIEV